MNLNRKSSKATTKVSFVVSVIMLVGLAVTIQAQGLPTDYLMGSGAQVCKAGFIDLVSILLW
ncbi:MAG: hypothetical protein COA86_08490 [Kangiella sp.]|nr:MAG: hypothetical protein COA86_08490 [Kangiella sp.]